MFEFPASPTTGQVSNGFQWDGEKWKGGQPSGPQKETFVDYNGKSSVDVAVPTWAKSCRVTMSIGQTAGGQMAFRVSVDGTTFLAGASDYTYITPYHVASPPAWNTVATTSGAQAPLTMVLDNTAVPLTIVAEIALVRAVASDGLPYKSHGTGFHNTSQLASAWYTGFVNTAPLAGALSIKALRFLGPVGKAGSHIHIKWLGDDAQVPISNAIPDCPSDGGEYVRANGDWRLKGQTYDLAGLASQIIPVPAWGPGFARLGIYAHGTAAVPTNLILRASGDGTTYPVGPTSEYAQGGFIYRTATAGVVTDAAWGFKAIELATTANTTEHASRSDTLVQLKRATTAQEYAVMTRGDTYHAFTGWAFSVMTYGASIKGGATLSLKGLQILTTTGTWVAGSRLNVEWLA